MHVEYLEGLIESGKLRASGRVFGSALRAGLLLFTAEDPAERDALIAAEIAGYSAELRPTSPR